MPHSEIIIPSYGISSLVWVGDKLVNPVGGYELVFADGGAKWEQTGFSLSGLLDAAIVSPSGRFTILFARLGTKAVILKDGAQLREINRSYYQAHAYEYPVAVFQEADGREILIHCPHEYNILQAEDIETGEIIGLTLI